MSDRVDQRIWLDGSLVPREQAHVSVYSHGLLYGDSIFEGLRFYNGRLFEAPAHMRRFRNGLRTVRMELRWTSDQLLRAINNTIEANGLTDGYVRLIALRGEGNLGIGPLPPDVSDPIVTIIAEQLQLYPKKYYESGIELITASTIRNHPAAVPAQVKSGNYLNNILAKLEACERNAPEAVMLNFEGYVTECTTVNLFCVREGALATPPCAIGALNGVTRRVVLMLARKSGLSAGEALLTRTDLYDADEIFITGTGAEICPVASLDNRTIGDGTPGPITRRVMDLFRCHTRGEVDILKGN